MKLLLKAGVAVTFLGFISCAQAQVSRNLISVPSTVGTSAVIVDAAKARTYLGMFNLDGTNSVGCTFDGTTPTIGAAGTMTFLPHQGFVWDTGIIPANQLTCIASGASTAFTVLE